jgi:hypothetical protein
LPDSPSASHFIKDPSREGRVFCLWVEPHGNNRRARKFDTAHPIIKAATTSSKTSMKDTNENSIR